jgi:hydroxymethylpyrimidine/phosphomethylpyrimidine kinase
MRGKGCTLAAALAVELARGKPLLSAVRAARRLVRAELAARAR